MVKKGIWELLFSDAVDRRRANSVRKERVYLSNSLQNDNRLYVIELTSILGTDFTIKINVKKSFREGSCQSPY